MLEELMKTVEVFVGQGNHAGITCPYCQRTYEVSVGKYKGGKHSIVTKCACQERFKIKLNFRQFYRKDVKLAGDFINNSAGSKDWHAMIVNNLSMIGLRFKATGSTGIEIGHQLRVKFTLDNQKATDLYEEVKVINIDGDQYRCEFLNKDYEKELGFYLRT